MKKLIAVTCLVIAMTTLLTACGKFKCDLCDKEFDRKEKVFYEFKEGVFKTDKYNVCQDCNKALEELESDEAKAILEKK